MGMLLFTKSTTAWLLITLAAGYLVCVLASKEQKFLKKAGLAIGSLIVISSLLLLACKLAWRIKTCCDVYKGTYSQRIR